MDMTSHQQMVAWLQDAYSMESKIIKVLEMQAKDTEDYPDIHDAIESHLTETRNHAEMVKECLESLDESVPTVESGMSKLMGMMEGVMASMAGDKLVKNIWANRAVEEFEIATYEAIIQLAEEMGHTTVVNKCEMILSQEEKMAEQLVQMQPDAIATLIEETEEENDDEQEDEDDTDDDEGSVTSELGVDDDDETSLDGEGDVGDTEGSTDIDDEGDLDDEGAMGGEAGESNSALGNDSEGSRNRRSRGIETF